MKAVIVVDMQKDFCYPDGALYAGDHIKEIFEPLASFLEKARGSMSIIFTQDWHRKDDKEFRIWPAHCIMNTAGAEIIDELNPSDEDYFVKKRRYSAFFGTDLDLILRELGCNEIILAGVLTNICVLHTAGDAVSRGYDVKLLKDCTVALTDYDYEYAIKHMRDVLNVKIIDSTTLSL
ncbi:Amidases related to nicotinamidase [Archaeoglobus sulfaticallidus PM70-1]|uniref:Amidases related to nicotinamidase n=1 Tax=Archaeoglobus sulfaticallidus PM70-1 TaxID=387631 RepID=N0BFM2_9EURY|nr:isochorismatase family cysteine hydrolase [Archaeoglobus sulfaticallidus]AGK61057.1 Amidases related to nicotinamidase [Archaeoglobus sulfaticallidus PM70-1]